MFVGRPARTDPTDKTRFALQAPRTTQGWPDTRRGRGPAEIELTSCLERQRQGKSRVATEKPHTTPNRIVSILFSRSIPHTEQQLWGIWAWGWGLTWAGVVAAAVPVVQVMTWMRGERGRQNPSALRQCCGPLSAFFRGDAVRIYLVRDCQLSSLFYCDFATYYLQQCPSVRGARGCIQATERRLCLCEGYHATSG